MTNYGYGFDKDNDADDDDECVDCNYIHNFRNNAIKNNDDDDNDDADDDKENDDDDDYDCDFDVKEQNSDNNGQEDGITRVSFRLTRVIPSSCYTVSHLKHNVFEKYNLPCSFPARVLLAPYPFQA